MRSISTSVKVGALALCSQLLTLGNANAAFIVQDGYDLLYTQPGTTFNGIAWQGVDLGNTLLGNLNGVDTIIHRLAPAVGAPLASVTIPIEVEALSLRTTNQVNLGAGLGYYYAMVMDPSILAGPAVGSGPGNMTINFRLLDQAVVDTDPDGTFSSIMCIDAALYYSTTAFGTASQVLAGATPVGFLPTFDLVTPPPGSNPANPPTWRHNPPGGPILIDGVNNKLNGIDTNEDFWPMSSLPPFPGTLTVHGVSSDPNGTIGVVYHVVPEPATSCFGLGVVVACLGARRRARSRQTSLN